MLSLFVPKIIFLVQIHNYMGFFRALSLTPAAKNRWGVRSSIVVPR